MAKIGIVSLGCPKNLVDSEEMIGTLAKAGHVIVADQNNADVILVNTCGFIESAKEESVDTILEMIRLKRPSGCRSVVVTGCLAQRYAEELSREIPEIDAILGVGQINILPEVIELTLSGGRMVDNSSPSAQWVESEARIRSTPPWTAYLKISEGCDNRCSYCAIPDIRGSFRSRPPERVIAEAQSLASQGVKEINLIGQDITRYGEDISGNSLVTLLRELLKVKGPEWFRLLYCYPTRITDELIDLVASEPRIAKYLDIPFQHGDDTILAMMNRRGTSADYLSLIKRIRSADPDIALRTSVIVGFPGESRREFRNLLDFVRQIEFDRVGVFQYSCEEGTPAAELPAQVPAETARRRYDRLMLAQQEISLRQNQALIGREIDVLVEQSPSDPEGLVQARSYRDAPDIDGVVFLKEFSGSAGDFVRARVTAATEYDLFADVVESV